jgi:hypothetical protein
MDGKSVTNGGAQRVGTLAALGAALLAAPAAAVEFQYSGYIREHLSLNLQNSDEYEVKGFLDPGHLATFGEGMGGKGELSMWRHSGKLEASADFGPFQIAGVGRIARETHTSYERGLQNNSKLNPAFTTLEQAAPLLNPLLPVGATVFANASAFTSAGVNALLGAPGCAPPAPCPFAPGLPGFGGGTTDDLVLSDYDSTELRELYTTFTLGERFHFKLGKQQVVWGETDFFRAMDIIHGYDLRWRSFLELENEELRKPLNLANVTIDVPELAGSLQLIFRPGWDAGDDMGDTAAINGGRWAPATWGGIGASSSLLAPYNYHHNLGDEKDANYGFRWSGTFKQIGYSFAYYRGLSTDGLVVRNPVLGGGTNKGRWEGNTFALGEQIFPMIETYGFTFNAYSGAIDSVLRGEFAFTPNKAYNTGTNTFVDLFSFLGATNAVAGGAAGNFFPGFPLLNDPNNPNSHYSPGTGGFATTAAGVPTAPVGATLSVPGFADIVEKDTLKIMLGLDKNLNWTMGALGTSRPAFWTLQLFDTWVMNFDRGDDIIENFGFGAARREHQTILTNALSFPFRYDTLTPGVALGVDLGSFDAFLVPSLDVSVGDHWRLRFEADVFLPRHIEQVNLGLTGSEINDARLLGTLHDRDQFVARITYQF